MDNPNRLTLGAYDLEGFPTPFYCYIKELPVGPNGEEPAPIAVMDRKMLFDFMAQTNIQRFECHGRAIEIEFSPDKKANEDRPQMFALEGDEEDTVNGTQIVWDVSQFGGKAHRFGYEDMSKLTTDGGKFFSYNIQTQDDPKDREFKTFTFKAVRTKPDDTNDEAMTGSLRMAKACFRRLGAFLGMIGGDMRSGMYDDKPANPDNPAPKP